VPETGYTRSPKLVKGALIQLAETLGVPVPNIIPFQYNPMTVSRTLTPWNPFDVSQNQRGALAPTVQPFDPQEKITMELELDASDKLEEGNPITQQFGVADRIAAIEKLLFPGGSPLGALLGAAAALLGGGDQPPQRPTVPIVLLVWGLNRIVPVRITSYSIEEQAFLPSLYPLMAKISLSMQVLTPDVFQCETGPSVEVAKAAYKLYRTQQDVLAVLHTANNLDAIRAVVPI
jgi:hypothetical protein